MSDPKPTNEVLANMIENLTKITERVEAHVVETNGRVTVNDAHRIKQQTSNKWMYGLLVLIIVPTLFQVVPMFVNLIE